MARKSENNYAFIDSQNLNLGVRSQGWILDFARFRVYLKDKFGVKKAFAFVGYVPGNEGLYTRLQMSGYIVIFKPTLLIKDEHGNETVKGNVDAELVLHTMIELPNYDKAVIVSGDGDFYCLVEHLQDLNKLERLVIPNQRRFSALLRVFRPHFLFLDGLKEKLAYKNKKRE